MGRKKPCKDHKGVEFESFSAMCRHYGKTFSCVHSRLNNGATLEEALTNEYYERPNIVRTFPTKECRDHLGNVYPTQGTMCRAYHIPVTNFLKRLERGWTLEQALTGNKKTEWMGVRCKDHLGNEFNSISAMCRYHGTTEAKYRHRIENGRTLEESLMPELTNHKKKKPCKDHLGNEYPSVTAMCSHYGVSKELFATRRNRLGWDLEKALSVPKHHFCNDGFGRRFSSVKNLCRYHKISYQAALAWKKDGFTIEDIVKRHSYLYKNAKGA